MNATLQQFFMMPELRNALLAAKVPEEQRVDDDMLCLHAQRISFTHPEDGRLVHFESGLPEWAAAAEAAKSAD